VNDLRTPTFVFDVEQGSEEWRRLRMGKATASNFNRIVTEVKGEYASGVDKYAREVAIQRMIMEDTEQPKDGLRWIERGKVLEPDAVKHYEKVRGRTTKAIGLVISADGARACSPDRISADHLWGVEIKCPSGPEHLEYMDDAKKGGAGPGTAYRWQVLGSILVAGFDGWSFVSYHPNLREVIVTYKRENFEKELKLLDDCLNRFEETVQRYCNLIRREGFIDPRTQTPTRAEAEWAKLLEADPNLWAL
jgi:hypothetical protein